MQRSSGNNSPDKRDMAATEEPMDVEDSNGNGLDSIKSLSRNAMRDICEGEKNPEIKNNTYYVQAADVKIFTEADNKKNIR